MNHKHGISAFYIETVLLIVVFMFVIVVLTDVFGRSKAVSGSARQLNQAVCLAENAAAAVAASETPEQAEKLLNEKENVTASSDGQGEVFCAYYDDRMQPSAGGIYRVAVTWEPEEGQGGSLVRSHISVCRGQSGKALYEIDTGIFIPRREP